MIKFKHFLNQGHIYVKNHVLKTSSPFVFKVNQERIHIFITTRQKKIDQLQRVAAA